MGTETPLEDTVTKDDPQTDPDEQDDSLFEQTDTY